MGGIAAVWGVRWRAWVTAGIVLLGCVFFGASDAARSASTVAPFPDCPAYVVMGTRGVGTPNDSVNGMSAAGLTFLTEFRKQLAGVRIERWSNPYQSLPNLLAAFTEVVPAKKLPDQLAVTQQYTNSVQSGVGQLTSAIEDQAAVCPKTRMVLVGHSEGAHVTGDAFQELPRLRRDRSVLGVVLFADPRFNKDDIVHLVTDFQRSTQTVLTRDGITSIVETGRRKPFPLGAVLSYCHEDDLVCQVRGFERRKGIWIISPTLGVFANIADFLVGLAGGESGTHSDYQNRGAPEDAAAFLAQAAQQRDNRPPVSASAASSGACVNRSTAITLGTAEFPLVYSDADNDQLIGVLVGVPTAGTGALPFSDSGHFVSIAELRSGAVKFTWSGPADETVIPFQVRDERGGTSATYQLTLSRTTPCDSSSGRDQTVTPFTVAVPDGASSGIWPASDGWWLQWVRDSANVSTYRWVGPAGQFGPSWTDTANFVSAFAGRDGEMYLITYPEGAPTPIVRLTRVGPDGPLNDLEVEFNPRFLLFDAATLGQDGNVYWFGRFAEGMNILQIDPDSLEIKGRRFLGGDTGGLVATPAGLAYIDYTGTYSFIQYSEFAAAIPDGQGIPNNAVPPVSGFRQISVGASGSATVVGLGNGNCSSMHIWHVRPDLTNWTKSLAELVGDDVPDCRGSDVDTRPDGTVVFTLSGTDGVYLLLVSDAGIRTGLIQATGPGPNATTVVDDSGVSFTSVTRLITCPDGTPRCSNVRVVGYAGASEVLDASLLDDDQQVLSPVLGLVGRPHLAVGGGQVLVEVYEAPLNTCGETGNCAPFGTIVQFRTVAAATRTTGHRSFQWY